MSEWNFPDFNKYNNKWTTVTKNSVYDSSQLITLLENYLSKNTELIDSFDTEAERIYVNFTNSARQHLFFKKFKNIRQLCRKLSEADNARLAHIIDMLKLRKYPSAELIIDLDDYLQLRSYSLEKLIKMCVSCTRQVGGYIALAHILNITLSILAVIAKISQRAEQLINITNEIHSFNSGSINSLVVNNKASLDYPLLSNTVHAEVAPVQEVISSYDPSLELELISSLKKKKNKKNKISQ